MAIIWMDGPDHYGTDNSLCVQGPYAECTFSLTQNNGPLGVGAVFQANTLGDPVVIRKVLPGLRSAVGHGARYNYYVNLPGSNRHNMICQWRDISNNPMFTLWTLSTGALQLVSGATGGTIYTTDPLLVAQSWQHVEAYISTGATTGSFRLGIDSVTVVDVDGLSSLGGYPDPAIAQIVVSGGLSGSDNFRFRDWYIWDTSGSLNNSGMQGDRQVLTSFPTGDGAATDWTPSSGSEGWELIDGNPPDDTAWISANEADQTSNFDFGDVDTDITSISAVMVTSRLWKSDAGIATVNLQMLSSGDTGSGTDQAVSTEKVFYNQIFETDPHTSTK
jgi:hypothetical protein